MATFTTHLSLGQKAFTVVGLLDFEIREVTVGQILVIETHPEYKRPFHTDEGIFVEKYMCVETGIGNGTLYTYGMHIFATRNEAEQGKIKHEQRMYKERVERDKRRQEQEEYQRQKDLETYRRLQSLFSGSQDG